MIALIDCNNFFCSVEKIFDPKIKNLPVVVVSNNDGCVVARSPESKSLGIPMGAPLFEIRELIEKNNVVVRSSNYTLYGDMSDRVMNVIRGIVPEMETYSIDEAFVDLSSYPAASLEKLAHAIRDKIKLYTGLPVSIGIAHTKVLAKLANKISKKGCGVILLKSEDDIKNAIHNFPIEDLWGIGRRHAKTLNTIGVFTAKEFVALPTEWVKKNMSVTGSRLQLELQGKQCIPMSFYAENKRAIGNAKSFGTYVTALDELKEALTNYVSIVAFKLRRQKSAATMLTVFLSTNYFNKREPQYGNSKTVSIPIGTNLTPVLLKYALHCLTGIYRAGFKYKRVGIMLSGFVPEESKQSILFESNVNPKIKILQDSIDSINKRFVRDQVRFASEGFERRWTMKREWLSPRYTTQIDEILVVRV